MPSRRRDANATPNDTDTNVGKSIDMIDDESRTNVIEWRTPNLLKTGPTMTKPNVWPRKNAPSIIARC